MRPSDFRLLMGLIVMLIALLVMLYLLAGWAPIIGILIASPFCLAMGGIVGYYS